MHRSGSIRMPSCHWPYPMSVKNQFRCGWEDSQKRRHFPCTAHGQLSEALIAQQKLSNSDSHMTRDPRSIHRSCCRAIAEDTSLKWRESWPGLAVLAINNRLVPIYTTFQAIFGCFHHMIDEIVIFGWYETISDKPTDIKRVVLPTLNNISSDGKIMRDSTETFVVNYTALGIDWGVVEFH